MNRDASDAPIGREVRPDWVPSNLYPFADRWMEIEGNQVHYVDEGQGPVLLFLHGNPTWSFLYRRQILDLRDRFRCIAVDYPGFGLSRARPGYDFTPREHSKVVEKLVGALALREITLMVQDWGGPIGLGMACRRPELVKALVIGSIWGTKDVAFKEKERRRFESIFPNHRTVILENANHLIQEDAPERVTEEIQRWSSAL